MVMPHLGPLEIGTIRNTRHLIPLGPHEGVLKEAEVTKYKCCYCGATLDTFAALKAHVELEHPIVIRPANLNWDEMPPFFMRFKRIKPISLEEEERIVETVGRAYDELKAFVKRLDSKGERARHGEKTT